MNEYITIQDASELSGKSVQTIRRAVKAGKLKAKKKRTPQGFNYSISKTSLSEFYGVVFNDVEETVSEAPKAVETTMKVENAIEKEQPIVSGSEFITRDDFKALSKTLEKMVDQHSDERQNFLRLVNTLQEKIFVMEGQINVLREPQKKWFRLWK